MSFVECFRKHDIVCQFVKKGSKKIGEIMSDLSD
jgi:hypothetical protein